MIHTLRLSEIASTLSARLIGGDSEFSNVCTDSREIQPGDLYVALIGQKFDGHNYVSDALKAGAVAVVVSLDWNPDVLPDSPVLKVRDTQIAYGEIARYVRHGFDGNLIALTGSCGKTSTKEIIATLLSLNGNVLATKKNLNNTIGVPKTLIELTKDHSFAVVEMGANAPGEIKLSVDFAEPNISMLLNASEAHTLGFGGLSGVRNAKSEIFSNLKPGQLAVLNIDDPGFEFFKKKVPAGVQVKTFGLNSSADVTAKHIILSSGKGSKFTLDIVGQMQEIELSLPGKHQILNFLAGALVAYECGCSLQQIADGAKKLKQVSGRLAPVQVSDDFVIYDDSYNASPASMKAGIDLLSSLSGKKLAILGDMAELGEESNSLHQEILDYASENLDAVWVVGEIFTGLAIKNNVEHFENKSEIVQRLTVFSKNKGVALLKGSRSMAMETILSDFNKLNNNDNLERVAP